MFDLEQAKKSFFNWIESFLEQKIYAIVATDVKGGIGLENKLLFKSRKDLSNFKNLTVGNIVIMGRKTFDSIFDYIESALPDRVNIVITSKKQEMENKFRFDNLFFVESKEEAIALSKEFYFKDIFVIGGGSVYELFKEDFDGVFLTVCDFEFKADTFFDLEYCFSNFDVFFNFKFSDNGLNFSFKELVRKE
jgi:dihydrofolate reductase